MADPRRMRAVPTNDPLLLTPDEADEVLRVGRTTVYALIKAGALRPVHIGRSCRISCAALERYVRPLEAPSPSASSRPGRRRRTPTDQRGLFELTPEPVDPA